MENDNHSISKENAFFNRRDPGSVHEHDQDRIKFIDLLRIGFVGCAIIAVGFGFWEPIASFNLFGVVATLIAGYPIFREAFSSLRKKRMTMELSMTIALFSALAIGEYVATLVIVFFVLAAEVLERMTTGRGRKAIQNLLDYMPQQAIISKGGQTREIRAAELRVGDLVVARPGSRIPVDGIVTSGNSFVDQSTITGESLSVEKLSGSQVYAGTMNQSGALEITATGIGVETAFGRIIQAVERAEKLRAPVQRIADKLAGYLVYFAFGSAVLTFLLTYNIRSTISVIIVMGACGVAAGTPLAILGAIGLAARKGVIVKGGIYLETLSRVDTVILDKTGTLTLGDPQVTEVIPMAGRSESMVLEIAAIAEHLSEHPLAKAIMRRVENLPISFEKPDHIQYLPGKGVICRLDTGNEITVGSRNFLSERGIDTSWLPDCPNHLTEVVVAQGQELLGAIHLADVLRPEATGAVQEMKQMGIKVALLTGDQANIADAVAQTLEVDEVGSGMLPDQKLQWVKNKMETGRNVVMVGDGVNDTPALTQANVGVAMGSGTDAARESAHVLLLGNDLSKLVDTLRIAKRCHRTIMVNFAGTLIMDGIGLVLAALGFLNPIIAAAIHVCSELVFILNSARLLPVISKERPNK